MVVKVPEGTVVKEAETGKVIVDMSHDCKREVILKGGRGGKGNMNYATPTMQVPKYAQPGKPGRELKCYTGVKNDRRCWIGRISECWKINISVPRHQCKAEDCKLSFYNLKP